MDTFAAADALSAVVDLSVFRPRVNVSAAA